MGPEGSNLRLPQWKSRPIPCRCKLGPAGRGLPAACLVHGDGPRDEGCRDIADHNRLGHGRRQAGRRGNPGRRRVAVARTAHCEPGGCAASANSLQPNPPELARQRGQTDAFAVAPRNRPWPQPPSMCRHQASRPAVRRPNRPLPACCSTPPSIIPCSASASMKSRPPGPALSPRDSCPIPNSRSTRSIPAPPRARPSSTRG